MVTRKTLEELLMKICNKNRLSKQFVNSVDDLMLMNHSVIPGITNEYIFGLTSLTSMSIEELLWFGESVQTVLIDKNVQISNYFTNNEIIAFSKTRKQYKKRSDIFPIIFRKVSKVTDDQWVCATDVNFLYILYMWNLINFQKTTQYSDNKNEKTSKADFNIALYNTSGDVDFYYIEETIELVLYDSDLVIIDDYSHFKEMIYHKINDISFDCPLIINITYDNTKVYDVIMHENNEIILESFDRSNAIHTLIQNLNDNKNCRIRGFIGENENSKIKSAELYDILSHNFEIHNKYDLDSLIRYLKKVFNTLIGHNLFESDFLSLAVIIRGAMLYRYNDNCIEDIEILVKRKEESYDIFMRQKKFTQTLAENIDMLGGIR